MKEPRKEIQTSYEKLRKLHERFTKKMKYFVSEKINDKKIKYHLVESRTKDIKSFQEKAFRPNKNYENPLKQITDITGLRIITHYQDDVSKIEEIIRDTFIVDNENSEKHDPENAEFKYKSDHYVVSIKNEMAQNSEWHEFANLKAEIQVRTILQHTWASLSHQLQYKNQIDVPVKLRRKLFRLAALFELADDESIHLRNEFLYTKQKIDQKLSEGNKRIAIDHTSLTKFIKTSNIVSKLTTIASSVGFDFSYPDNPNDSNWDMISELNSLVNHVEIETLEQLEDNLQRALPWSEEYLRSQYYHGEYSNPLWLSTPAFTCELIVIKIHLKKVDIDLLLKLGWDKEIGSRILRIANTT